MRATWPTARKSEPEPGASAGARLRNRSGDNRMNRLSLFFCGRGAPDAPCPAPGSCPRVLPMSLPRELQGSGAAYSGGACRSPSVRRLGAVLLHGEGMRGGPPARRNVRAAECFSPVPSAIVLLSPVPSAGSALLFPVPVRAARFFGKKMRWGEINAIFAPKSSEA